MKVRVSTKHPETNSSEIAAIWSIVEGNTNLKEWSKKPEKERSSFNDIVLVKFRYKKGRSQFHEMFLSDLEPKIFYNTQLNLINYVKNKNQLLSP